MSSTLPYTTKLVKMVGFEPTALPPQTECSAKLSYTLIVTLEIF